MKESFSNLYKSFSNYYQETTIRRLIVGLILGILLWFSFLAFTIIIDILTVNTVWWDTFLIDLPGIGVIAALLLTFQIWGLLPQPANDFENVKIPKENTENITSDDLSREEKSTVETESEK
jgi:hypothetical protein